MQKTYPFWASDNPLCYCPTHTTNFKVSKAYFAFIAHSDDELACIDPSFKAANLGIKELYLTDGSPIMVSSPV